ncbi:Hypothetical predicted protein [Cloeon dipterum]|uniref:Uncharacterized protein n=1 Tax=Cloeon dipterum TaxID=197152 RepID=A0A8S1DD89_9INSE|nr:Hypothetical predicted protein [Cloeon dipterum]
MPADFSSFVYIPQLPADKLYLKSIPKSNNKSQNRSNTHISTRRIFVILRLKNKLGKNCSVRETCRDLAMRLRRLREAALGNRRRCSAAG